HGGLGQLLWCQAACRLRGRADRIGKAAPTSRTMPPPFGLPSLRRSISRMPETGRSVRDDSDRPSDIHDVSGRHTEKMSHSSISRRPRRWPLVVAAAFVPILGLLVSPDAAVGAAPSEITVDSDGPARFWTGDVAQNGATIPSVPECASSSCDHAKVKVKLPTQIWQRKPGGLEVSIRWQG